ncbi:hypothetical protein AB2C39_34500, partial [Pseudomonas aeruginosa]
MTDHAELRRLAEEVIRIERSEDEPISSAWELFDSAANPKAILALLDEIDRLSDELSACTEHPGGCGYWREAAKRRAEERDRLKAENEAVLAANRDCIDWFNQIKTEYDECASTLPGVYYMEPPDGGDVSV